YSLGEGNASPEKLGHVLFNGLILCAVIDAENGYAYFGGQIHHIETRSIGVWKVGLRGQDGLPYPLDFLYLKGLGPSGYFAFHNATIDPTGGFAYFEDTTSKEPD